MAKSLRSKTKRAFRSKKRESGVYAAVHAARLQRLNQKLVSITKQDADGDVVVGDAEEEVQDVPGWCWLSTLGLLHHEDITPESMDHLVRGCPGLSGSPNLMERSLLDSEDFI
ncbi:hypothetical protein D9613_005583 [Agrocybe pediades]|uniref:DUF2423 domain-containing protein n=1 Tax=Agrocybe pediades TaxID=84607 RepID=A0A8H4VTW3_9AGAR|nr:hypothetical protein D9613_005583 [Agrocybe pediades]